MEAEILKAKLIALEYEQHELKDRIFQLTDFVENASVPLNWVNGSGIIIWVNTAELQLLGYERSEYLGKHISKFHADTEVIEDILARLIRKETLKNYQARLRCKNGDIKTVLINSNVLWRGDQFQHTRCFTRDITELQKKQDEKDQALRQLEEENRQLKLENFLLQNRIRHSVAD